MSILIGHSISTFKMLVFNIIGTIEGQQTCDGQVIYEKNEKEVIFLGEGLISDCLKAKDGYEKITISDGILGIKESAFYGFNKLSTINISNSVISIGIQNGLIIYGEVKQHQVSLFQKEKRML